MCEWLAQGRYLAMRQSGVEPTTCWLQVQRPNYHSTKPHLIKHLNHTTLSAVQQCCPYSRLPGQPQVGGTRSNRTQYHCCPCQCPWFTLLHAFHREPRIFPLPPSSFQQIYILFTVGFEHFNFLEMRRHINFDNCGIWQCWEVVVKLNK